MRRTLCFIALFVALAIPNARAETTEHIGFALGPPRMGTWGVLKSLGGKVVPPTLCSRAGGESGTGTLLSKSFLLEASKVRMAVRGWSGFPDQPNDKNRLELIDAQTGEILRKSKPPQSTPNAKWVEWDVEDLKGRRVRLRLIDGDNGSAYAWFAVDAIDAGDALRVSFDQSASLEGWELKDEGGEARSEVGNHHGVPFLASGEAIIPDGQALEIPLGIQARRLFLFGMTNSIDIGTPLWHYPTNYSVRYWVGDKLGEVRLNYEDGTSEAYPLILGDSMWWGDIFHKYPEPFLSKPGKMQTLKESLRLFPADPVADSTRLAFIRPKPKPIRSISLIDRSGKGGVPRVRALTAEVLAGQETDPEMTTILPEARPTEELAAFLANETNAMQPEGMNQEERKARLRNIRNVLYTTEESFPKSVKIDIPEGYRGPRVRFEGNVHAEILTNVFHRNLSDMNEKADPSGMYRESTMHTAMFGGYNGFGTYVTGPGPYRDHVWSRGVGREMQEFLAFGNLEKAVRCVEYCFREARNWNIEKNPALQIDGHPIPPHWGRIINRPAVGPHRGVFENDGHGLIMLLVYNVWRRLPDRDAWLRENWEDVRLAAEWILWQFENPKISGATDVLLSDSEGVFMIGIGVRDGNGIYCDIPCMEGLRRFAEMAESIGEQASAARWRERADKMRAGIERNYIWHNPTGERPDVWTLWGAAWAHQSSQLAPLILAADTAGLAPEDDDPAWRALSEASYQRLIDKWRGKGAGRLDDEFWYLPHERPLAETAEQHFLPFGSYFVSLGYGQGFITQAALLLDRMDDAREMLDWTARAIYNADFEPYIVPEGAEIHPDGKAWFRTGDLGNGFQQASIMKVFRVLIGVDDADPTRLRLIPRMPRDWTRTSVKAFPAWIDVDSGRRRVSLDYVLSRKQDAMELRLKADRPLGDVEVRLGPFDTLPKELRVQCNGRSLDAQREASGDSLWVRVKLPTGLPMFILEVKGKIH